MIKEDQYAEADPDGVGNLQDGKAGGTFSRNKSVKLAKKAAHIYVIIKGHNGKSGAEKGNQAYKKDFYIPENFPCGRADAVGDDKIRFPDGRNINGGFPLLDLFQKIRDRHHIASGLFRIQNDHRHDPQTIEDFGVTHGKCSDILKIYMWVGDFNVLIQLQIKTIADEKKTPFPESYFFIFGRKKRLAR